MKCTQWIYVYKEHQEQLEKWSSFIVYDTYDSKGEINAYKMVEFSEKYNNFLKDLNSLGIPFSVFRREYSFTSKEIDNAEILELSVEKPLVKEFRYQTKPSRCPKCGDKIVTIMDSITVEKPIKTKYDIFTLFYNDDPIIISRKLKDIFEKEFVKGVEFRPIFLDGFNTEIKDYFHLVVRETKKEIISPTILKPKNYCDVCHRYEEHLVKTNIYLSEKPQEDMDVFYSKEWFGGRRSTQLKILMITQKIHKILKSYNINVDEWAVTPVIIT